jgi:TolB-like protein
MTHGHNDRHAARTDLVLNPLVSAPEFGPGEKNEIMEQLARMLQSDLFAAAERLGRFLLFLVNRNIEDGQPPVDQHTIAVEVFDRPDSFNPEIDPIVRVEAGRLRAKLREYYDSAGKHDPIRIDLAKRGYSLVIERRGAGSGDSNVSGDPSFIAPKLSGLAEVGCGPQPVPKPASIAVLPFDDLSSSGSFGYFCESLTQQVMEALLKQTDSNIAARGSTRQLKEGPQDVREIGRLLGVDMVLEGSIQKVGDTLRVSTLLADTDTGRHVWSQVYERPLTDVFATQDDVSQMIARDLRKILHKSGSDRRHRSS